MGTAASMGWVEARGAGQHPIVHRTAPISENDWAQNGSCAEGKKTCPKAGALHMCSPDRQLQLYLGTCYTCKSLGPTPDFLNQKQSGPSSLCSKSSRGFRSSLNGKCLLQEAAFPKLA